MDEPVVTVKQGKLQGVVLKSVLGPSYIAFRGIPYAAPPIGELRFKDPQPCIPWTGIKDTSKYVGSLCKQRLPFPPRDIIGDEDCLHLNVYTNSIHHSKPVIFWIHGGSFVTGTGNYESMRPDYMLAKDVVFVSCNYRLGAFGFLNLEHRAAPGNQGLKDLIAALEWVKENIANFGGDPNNVTINGASAGGALAHAISISPRARGLFHKVIMQSGTMLCTWSLGKPENCFKLASLLGIDSNDPEEIVKLLRTVSAQDIVKAQSSVLTKHELRCYDLIFGINIDEVAENPVLPLPFEQLYSNAYDIPILLGHTTHEFILFLADKSQRRLNICEEYLPLYARKLGQLNKIKPEETEEFVKTIKNWYFKGRPISESNIFELLDLMSDLYFVLGIKVFIENRVKSTSSPTYYYNYSYVGNEKALTDLLIKRFVIGASHQDDVSYLLYNPHYKTENPSPPAEGTKDRVIMERLTKMWSNFAKTGNPTSCYDGFIETTWEPATEDKICYLNIDEELKMVAMKPHILSSI
ncbi:esterase FE4-like [Colletes latitarsis]|uniref:esterase FE4-like n=1 Tax=Colletes latitarsis TaxID=2605962 RepID=UPI00403542BC